MNLILLFLSLLGGGVGLAAAGPKGSSAPTKPQETGNGKLQSSSWQVVNAPDEDTEDHAQQETEEPPHQDTEDHAQQETEDQAQQETEDHAQQETEDQAQQETEDHAQQETEDHAQQETEEHDAHGSEEHAQQETEEHDAHGPEEPPHQGSEEHEAHGSEPTVAPPAPGATQAEIDAYVAAVRSSGEVHVHDSHSALMGEHGAALNLVPKAEATHIAISDGDWFDASTWYSGAIPGDDARVLIPEGVDVTYGDVSDARLFTVRVDGTLDFATDADSKMIFDTFVVSPTGHLVIGTESNPIADHVDVDLIVANNGPIDTDWDPLLLSRGLISHGKSTIHGAVKDSHEKVIDDPMAGDTSVSFADVPEGWQVGDTIIIAGTHFDGYKWDSAIGDRRLYENEDEERMITGIDADGTIHFDAALIYDHDTPRADLKTSVANYTRNISVETENADTAEVYERGHVMFMHSDDVDVRYAEFHELGRTDKSEDSFDVGDLASTSYDSNVQGRYSLHLHRTGVSDPDDPAIVSGNAVYGSPGWGYVHHDSNAILSNNASFDTYGAGYVAETGNETGAWTDNIAIFSEGPNWSIPKNTTEIDNDTFDTARGGDGFWFQGRLVQSTDNIAASVNTGFVYFHRDGDDRMIDFDAGLFAYPDALFGEEYVDPEDTPILTFIGNETFAAREGLHIVKGNPNQGHDVWSQLEDFTAWSVKSGAHLEYTSHYILRDFDVIGKEPTLYSDPGSGISLGKNTSEITIIDAQVADFQVGIDLKKAFVKSQYTPDLHDYVVIDATITDTDTPYANYDPSLDQIISSGSLPGHSPELSIDGSLSYEQYPNGSFVYFNGTKTDSLGTTEFPGGSDVFRMDSADVVRTVEEDGYWTTSDGQTYFLVDVYFTDRVTGEVFYETHPVNVNDQAAAKFGNPNSSFSGAVHNGTQNLTTEHGILYAGDVPLDVPIPATPSAPTVPQTFSDDTMALSDHVIEDDPDMPMIDPIDHHIDTQMQEILAQDTAAEQDDLQFLI